MVEEIDFPNANKLHNKTRSLTKLTFIWKLKTPNLLFPGDQIIAINGVSLVGLPLSTCQTYIKNSKNQTVVKLTVVPCAPVVEVKIKRPDTKYQLGFSVQNGVVTTYIFLTESLQY